MDSSIYMIFRHEVLQRSHFNSTSALENVGAYRQSGFHSSAFSIEENYFYVPSFFSFG